MKIMNPSVNINGTSREELVETRRKALALLSDTIAALQQTQPHGRDYVGRDHQYSLDRALHKERVKTLNDIYDSLMEEAVAINKAGPRGGEA